MNLFRKKQEPVWADLSADELMRECLTAAKVFGCSGSDADLDVAMEVFGHASNTLTQNQKANVVNGLRRCIREGSTAARCLVPIVSSDGDPAVVGGGVRSLIQGSTARNDGSGVSDGLVVVASLLAGKAVRCPGGVLGGILGCGDRRLLPTAQHVSTSLDIEGIVHAAQCVARPLSVGCFEFWLWMAQGTVGRSEMEATQRYAAACSALSVFARFREDVVRDYEHRWGSVDGFDTAKILVEIPFREFRRQRVAELEAVAASEKQCGAMRITLASWDA